jgi:hypothetical protein
MHQGQSFTQIELVDFKSQIISKLTSVNRSINDLLVFIATIGLPRIRPIRVSLVDSGPGQGILLFLIIAGCNCTFLFR